MSRDYAEIEREFIAELEARTGKDLAQWLTAIDAARLADKNAIIDWLRPQGFTFANASWLERIHHNGGRPIYEEGAAQRAAEAIKKSLKDTERADPASLPSTSNPSLPPASGQRSLISPELEPLLAKGKAYRPLAVLLLAEIAKAMPDVRAQARDAYISITHDAEFAALDIRPKELRLGFALGDHPLAHGLSKARLNGAGAHITHMIVLTDARQVDARLTELLVAASRRTRR